MTFMWYIHSMPALYTHPQVHAAAREVWELVRVQLLVAVHWHWKHKGFTIASIWTHNWGAVQGDPHHCT